MARIMRAVLEDSSVLVNSYAGIQMKAAAAAVPSAANASESVRIQTLRGIACVLLVSFHVVQGQGGSTLLPSAQSPYVTLTAIFAHLRMPLFTFLSGFVYAYRPVASNALGEFASRKLLRLLVPLLVVSTLFFVVQTITPGTNTKMAWEEMWRIYVFPYVHFWFLQAIILIFAFVAVLEQQRLLESFDRFLIVFVLALVAHFSLQEGANFFSWKRAVNLAPFFLLGLAANRFRAQIQNAPTRYLSLAVFLLTTIPYVVLCVVEPADAPEKRTVWATAISLSACLTLLHWVPHVRWLAWVGGFSFTIYLYHVFFTASTRIALGHSGVPGIHEHFALGLLAGVAGPILIELALRCSPMARRILLGQS